MRFGLRCSCPPQLRLPGRASCRPAAKENTGTERIQDVSGHQLVFWSGINCVEHYCLWDLMRCAYGPALLAHGVS